MSSNALATRAYLKEFGGAMLPLSIVLIQDHPAAPWRWLVALLPVVPVALAFWAILRSVARMDELQRRIQFEALVVSAGGTIIFTFGYGMLQNVGLPPFNLMFVTPLIVALWGLGLAWISQRYR